MAGMWKNRVAHSNVFWLVFHFVFCSKTTSKTTQKSAQKQDKTEKHLWEVFFRNFPFFICFFLSRSSVSDICNVTHHQPLPPMWPQTLPEHQHKHDCKCSSKHRRQPKCDRELNANTSVNAGTPTQSMSMKQAMTCALAMLANNPMICTMARLQCRDDSVSGRGHSDIQYSAGITNIWLGRGYWRGEVASLPCSCLAPAFPLLCCWCIFPYESFSHR